jgi:hypothetical protein
MAFERVWGPILPHERIDIGLAQVSLYLVKLLSRSRRDYKLRDFMPAWYRELTAEAETKASFEHLIQMARDGGNSHSDD